MCRIWRFFNLQFKFIFRFYCARVVVANFMSVLVCNKRDIKVEAFESVSKSGFFFLVPKQPLKGLSQYL